MYRRGGVRVAAHGVAGGAQLTQCVVRITYTVVRMEGVLTM